MAKSRKPSRLLTANQAMTLANRYILFNYPTMYTGGLPGRLILKHLDVWAMPIVLTHPDHGVIGDVGLVAVAAASGQVVGSTPRSRVIVAGKKLREAKRYDLETAFLRTRAV